MSTQPPNRGRTHAAAAAREAILNAAESIFAEQGFAGARSDAIAKASGYNSALIFHYFGDKLGLYTEVLQRADKALSAYQRSVLTPLMQIEGVAENADTFKEALQSLVNAYFDFVVEHPRFIRILLWEQAAGWRTFAHIASQFTTEDADSFQKFFDKAYQAGVLRNDFAPIIQMTLILQICIAYHSFIPLYEMALPPGDGSSMDAGRGRDYLVAFVIHGMINSNES